MDPLNGLFPKKTFSALRAFVVTVLGSNLPKLTVSFEKI